MNLRISISTIPSRRQIPVWKLIYSREQWAKRTCKHVHLANAARVKYPAAEQQGIWLQEYDFIALDIFRKKLQNKGVAKNNRLEAWLTFLSEDDPELIVNLIDLYPDFKVLYREVYELCRDTERIMGIFSKELEELDKNTVQYMIDEMQDTIDAQKEQLIRKDATIEQLQKQIKELMSGK